MNRECGTGENKLLNLYICLYVFTMFNREFQPYGWDFRYIVFVIGIILVVLNQISSGFIIEIHREINWTTFYIWAFLSDLLWINNGLPMNVDVFIRENILLANVFLGFKVFTIYFDTIDRNIIDRAVVISALVLSFSMTAVFFGIPLENIGGNPDYVYIYRNMSLEDLHFNIFGMTFRVGGYANDPNYASILMIGAFMTVIQMNSKKSWKVILTVIFLLMYGIALSKTVLIALLTGVIALILRKIVNIYVSKISIYDALLLAMLFFVSFVFFRIDAVRAILPQTITIRFDFWKNAEKLFFRNPLFGNGITSFRSYFSINHWYVQAHNTFWQVLSELGILGFILYIANIFKSLSKAENDAMWFLGYVFVFWIVSCESIALQFSAYFLLLQFVRRSNDGIYQLEVS